MKCLQEQAADGTHLLFLAAVYKLLYLLYTKDAATVDHVLRHRSRRDFERIEQSMQYVKRNYTNPITLNCRLRRNIFAVCLKSTPARHF